MIVLFLELWRSVVFKESQQKKQLNDSHYKWNPKNNVQKHIIGIYVTTVLSTLCIIFIHGVKTHWHKYSKRAGKLRNTTQHTTFLDWWSFADVFGCQKWKETCWVPINKSCNCKHIKVRNKLYSSTNKKNKVTYYNCFPPSKISSYWSTKQCSKSCANICGSLNNHLFICILRTIFWFSIIILPPIMFCRISFCSNIPASNCIPKLNVSNCHNKNKQT